MGIANQAAMRSTATASKGAAEARHTGEQIDSNNQARQGTQRSVVAASHAPRRSRLRNVRRSILPKNTRPAAAVQGVSADSKQKGAEQRRDLSPTTPLHFSKATGRPAFGPWVGAFGTPAHVLDSQPALYVDNVGHTHFGLSELNAAAAGGAHPARKANSETAISVLQAELPGVIQEARRDHSREMAALLRKPTSKYPGLAPRCSKQDMRRTRALTQPRQGY